MSRRLPEVPFKPARAHGSHLLAANDPRNAIEAKYPQAPRQSDFTGFKWALLLVALSGAVLLASLALALGSV